MINGGKMREGQGEKKWEKEEEDDHAYTSTDCSYCICVAVLDRKSNIILSRISSTSLSSTCFSAELLLRAELIRAS